jgi:hypothetical protein
VVAGTATAVSGRVQRRQAERFADRDANIAAQRQASYEEQVAPAAPQQSAPAAAAEPAADPYEQLKQLGELKAQGILTEEEFAAEKAKILGS